MYPEYNKINNFLAEAELLQKTEMTMADIYKAIMDRNKNRVAAIYINEKDKIKSYKYKTVESNVNYYAYGIARKLKDQEPGNIVALKHANSPAWPELFWAILMAGFKPLLIDARTGKDGTENLIRQSKAVGIVTDDMFSYSVKKVIPEDLIEYKGERIEPRWANEVIFCSSGTTGDVKLMVFSPS